MLQHEDVLPGNFVLVCTDNVYQGLVRVLLRHCVGGFELALGQVNTVDDFVCDLLSAAVHDFGHAGGRPVHGSLPQCLVFNVQNNWNLLLQKLKHDSALIAKSEKSDVKR